jgi:hypothetical protein
MRMFRQFRKFILVFSGAHEEVLAFAPADRPRFESLGWAILITGCLAVISMWFALTSALGINAFFAIPMALLWGVVITGIVRWLITSMPVDGRRKFAVAVPRLLLALLLGALIATPIVLRVFQSEINAQIAVTQQNDYTSYLLEQENSPLSQQIAAYTNELGQLDATISSQGAQVGNPATDSQLVADKQQLNELEAQLSHWTAVKAAYYSQYTCEVYGGAQCPKAGAGVDAAASFRSYQQASQQVTSHQAQINVVQAEIQQREQLLTSTSASSQQQRYQEALTQRRIVQADYDTAAEQSGRLMANYLAQQQASSRGIVTRLRALSDLSNGNAAVAGARLLLFLLFLFIASLPVVVKLLQKPGMYEAALQRVKVAEQRDYEKFFSTRSHMREAIWQHSPPDTAGDRKWVAISPPPPPDEAEDSEFAMSEVWSPTQSLSGRGDLGQGRLATVGGDYYASAGDSGGEPPYSGNGDSGGGGQRYLQARYPESIPVGTTFGLRVSVVSAAVPGGAALKPFAVPRGGRDVRLEAYAPPGLRLLGDRLLTVHVPADGDSEQVMFDLCADAPGVRTMSVTAWINGSYLGELSVDITAEHGNPAGTYRNALAEISTEQVEGAVSLVVRFDSRQNAYRFEFRDEDNPGEVTGNLAYDPGPRVEQLIASLEALAKGRSGHQPDQIRAYLMNSGAALWHELVPKDLRDQFWERQDRIRQLTILAEKDAVPWELLYPMDPNHDEGFLVEQFPVTRGIFNRRPSRNLSLWPARFVLPIDSLPEARAEIDAIRVSLDPGQPLDEVISGSTPLQNLITSGNFGLLHFACHNAYDPVAGSSIKFGEVPFTPTDLTGAAINKFLARSAPTVFINACRSAGLAATYNRLDGWATKFLEAGAAAFIGSLWAVSDGAAREFAQELYGQLQTGSPLGEAVKRARTAAASQSGDPTWLAYAVYGDPRATVGQVRP